MMNKTEKKCISGKERRRGWRSKIKSRKRRKRKSRKYTKKKSMWRRRRKKELMRRGKEEKIMQKLRFGGNGIRKRIRRK